MTIRHLMANIQKNQTFTLKQNSSANKMSHPASHFPSSKFQQLQQLQHDETHYNESPEGNRSLQKHYGSYIIIFRNEDGQPTYALGPHYYIFIVALLALTVLFIMLIASMKEHLTTVWFVVMIICAVLFFLSYLNIGLSIPGFASKAQQPNQEDKVHPRFCKPCKIIKTQNIYHCYDCDVCIEGYDHHCPWIGKCVGRQNLKAFYIFLIMTFGTLLMCFVATLASNIGNQNKHLRTNDDKDKYVIKG